MSPRSHVAGAAAGALLVATFLASCGAVSTDHRAALAPTDPMPAGNHEMHRDVDARRGTLRLPSGVRVEIVEDLLRSSTRVVLRELEAADVVPNAERTIGPALVVEPAMVPESCDGVCVFMISIPAALVPAGVTESCLALAQENSDDGSIEAGAEAWTIVPAHVDGDRLVGGDRRHQAAAARGVCERAGLSHRASGRADVHRLGRCARSDVACRAARARPRRVPASRRERTRARVDLAVTRLSSPRSACDSMRLRARADACAPRDPRAAARSCVARAGGATLRLPNCSRVLAAREASSRRGSSACARRRNACVPRLAGRRSPSSAGDFDDWICDVLLDPSGALFREGRILTDEPTLTDRGLYHGILAAIAGGATRRGQIAATPGRPDNTLAHPLDALVDLALVERVDDPLHARRSFFRLAEPLLRTHRLLIAPNEGTIERRGARATWRAVGKNVASSIYGPHFEHLAREWTHRYASERTLGGTPQAVGPSVVADTAARSELEVDVVATTGKRVLAIGEAKWSGPVGLGVFAELEKRRALLGKRGEDAKLLLFSGNGFDRDLRTAAKKRRDLELVDLERLYDGE